VPAPERGDVVLILMPSLVVPKQAGRRPALILSPKKYNAKVGLALACPITSQVEGYPFEVLIRDGLPVSGAVLSDQLRSLDWRARKAEVVFRLPADTVREVLDKARVLLE
jgi:mRNA interferase MazF